MDKAKYLPGKIPSILLHSLQASRITKMLLKTSSGLDPSTIHSTAAHKQLHCSQHQWHALCESAYILCGTWMTSVPSRRCTGCLQQPKTSRHNAIQTTYHGLAFCAYEHGSHFHTAMDNCKPVTIHTTVCFSIFFPKFTTLPSSLVGVL